MMVDTQIADIKKSEILSRCLELIKDRPSVGSLSEADEFASDEMRQFLLYSQNIQESPITGSEAFPGEMLSPSSENILMSSQMLDRMVEYYIATYVQYNFRKPLGEGHDDSIIIRVRMNRFGRCRIGSEIFGSVSSSRHAKSAYILAKFITHNNKVVCYPGQVQYFFNHTVDLTNEGASSHNLAYVRWYKQANNARTQFYFSIKDDMKTCNVELWTTEFYPESRDCIIPVHHILGRFVPIKYKIPSGSEYLAINPINRKFHI